MIRLIEKGNKKIYLNKFNGKYCIIWTHAKIKIVMCKISGKNCPESRIKRQKNTKKVEKKKSWETGQEVVERE